LKVLNNFINCIQSIEKLPYTHFLSIPLPGLRTEIKSFYKELLESFSPTSTPGFDESIFVDPSQLHLTILMLKLYTQEASEQASALLKSCMPKVYDLLQTRTEMIHCYGLEIMNDDPSSVDVLYLKLKEADGGKRLAAVCGMAGSPFKFLVLCADLALLLEYLVQAFRDAGLADPPDDHVKVQLSGIHNDSDCLCSLLAAYHLVEYSTAVSVVFTISFILSD